MVNPSPHASICFSVVQCQRPIWVAASGPPATDTLTMRPRAAPLAGLRRGCPGARPGRDPRREARKTRSTPESAASSVSGRVRSPTTTSTPGKPDVRGPRRIPHQRAQRDVRGRQLTHDLPPDLARGARRRGSRPLRESENHFTGGRPAPAGPYGTSSTFPVVRRPSRARCASAARVPSGNSWPIRILQASLAHPAEDLAGSRQELLAGRRCSRDERRPRQIERASLGEDLRIERARPARSTGRRAPSCPRGARAGEALLERRLADRVVHDLDARARPSPASPRPRSPPSCSR